MNTITPTTTTYVHEADTVKTRGISPKVWIPGVGQLLVGGALIALGFDVEGRTAIATGLGTLLAGFGSGAGRVETVGTGSPVD